MTKQGMARADGRALRDMYLYKFMTTIPAENTFKPLSQGGCVLQNCNS